MRRARFVLLVTLVACLTPGPAFAHIGWWDFLDELSGPGPFTPLGVLGDVRLWCNSSTKAKQVHKLAEFIESADAKKIANVDSTATKLLAASSALGLLGLGSGRPGRKAEDVEATTAGQFRQLSNDLRITEIPPALRAAIRLAFDSAMVGAALDERQETLLETLLKDATREPDLLHDTSKWQFVGSVKLGDDDPIFYGVKGAPKKPQNYGQARLDCLSTARSYVELRGGWIQGERRPLFADLPEDNRLEGRVNVWTAQMFFMRTLDPSLSIGSGAGVIQFFGKTVPEKPMRMVVTPFSIAYRPLQVLFRNNPHANIVTFHFETIAILGNLTATDFNPAAEGAAFKSKTDLVPSVSFSFDFLQLPFLFDRTEYRQPSP